MLSLWVRLLSGIVGSMRMVIFGMCTIGEMIRRWVFIRIMMNRVSWSVRCVIRWTFVMVNSLFGILVAW